MLIFSILCLLHLWVISFFAFVSFRKNRSNLFFAVFLFLFSFIHIQHVFLQSGLLGAYPYLDPLCGVTITLSFASYYLYIKSLCSQGRSLPAKEYLHLLASLPAVINLIYLLIFKQSADLKEYYYQLEFTYTIQNSLLLMGMSMMMALYIWLGNRELIKYERFLKDNYSDVGKRQLDWLYNLNWLLIALAVVIGPVLILMEKQSWNVIVMGSYTSLMYLFTLYKTFNTSIEQTTGESVDANKVIAADDSRIISLNEKQIKISEAKESEIYLALIEYLHKQQPWLDPELSLNKVSRDIDQPSYQVSYVINSRFEKNFFDLINEYRVNYSQKKLSDSESDKITLEEIAELCGFGSKATFNRAFKKVTGKSPNEFRKKSRELEVSPEK